MPSYLSPQFKYTIFHIFICKNNKRTYSRFFHRFHPHKSREQTLKPNTSIFSLFMDDGCWIVFMSPTVFFVVLLHFCLLTKLKLFSRIAVLLKLYLVRVIEFALKVFNHRFEPLQLKKQYFLNFFSLCFCRPVIDP